MIRQATFLWGAAHFPDVSQLALYPMIGRVPQKPYELLFYAIALAALVAYFSAVAWIVRRPSLWFPVSPVSRAFLGIAAFLLNAALLRHFLSAPSPAGSWAALALIGLAWLMVAALPLYGTRLISQVRRVDWAKQWNPANTGRVYGFLILLAAVQVLWTLYPFIFEPMRMMGEYHAIPQHTLLVPPGSFVRDVDYIDSHGLMGRNRRYDLERDKADSPAMADAACVKLPLDKPLQEFLAREQRGARYVYETQRERLCAVEAVPDNDWLELRDLAASPAQRTAVDQWFADAAKYARQLQERGYSAEALQFLRLNDFMFGFQYSSMWVLHHHNFVLAPLNEWELGKDRSEIFAQYGWLNLWMTGALTKLLGGLSYQSYFKVWYSYYYLYYLFFFLVMLRLLRHQGYVAAAALLAVGILCHIDFQWLLQGPGLNPVRRLWEFPVLFFLCQYVRTQRSRYDLLLWLTLALAVLNNWQSGFVAYGAVLFSLLTFQTLESQRDGLRWQPVLSLGIKAAVLLGVLWWTRQGPDPLSAYYLAGVSTLSTPVHYIAAFLLTGSALAVILMKTFRHRSPLSYACLFLLLYTTGMMVYSVWGGTLPHLIVHGPLYAALLVTFTLHGFRGSRLLRPYTAGAAVVLVVLGLAVFIRGGWNQDETKANYYGILNNHLSYEWNFDRAKFISTMDPRFFADGISLIQRHEKQNGIHILSRYDNLLPFLAGKYSAMPYLEVAKFLVSPRETLRCTEFLKNTKPAVLFVDTDIRRSFAADRIHSGTRVGDGVHWTSQYHVQRLSLLQEIFLAVQDDYELVEKGILISVYRRK